MSRFDDWWRSYPIKKAKQVAKKSWNRQNLDDRADELIEILEKQKKHDSQWKVGIGIPHPSTYLNQARWEDEVYVENKEIKPEWSKLPFNDAELMNWASSHGFPLARPGEHSRAYRGRLQAAIEQREGNTQH